MSPAIIGCREQSDLCLPHRSVALEHARLCWVEGDQSWRIQDLGSLQGTRRNGQGVQGPEGHLLGDGDLLSIGPFALRVRLLNPQQCTGTHSFAGERSAREGLSRALRGFTREEDASWVLEFCAGPQRGLRIPCPGPGRSLTIGRSRRCDLRLADLRLSRRHATLEADDAGVSLIDLGSQNGIFVDGRRVTSPCRLRPGMEIQLGSSTLRVRDDLAVDSMAAQGELSSFMLAPREGVDWLGASVGLGGMILSGLVLVWLLGS